VQKLEDEEKKEENVEAFASASASPLSLLSGSIRLN